MRKALAPLMSSARGDWRTPAPLYALLTERTPRFDVTDRHGGEFDAFRDPWPEPWFANPPYGREIAKWVLLMPAKGRGVALLPARTDTSYFPAAIWNEEGCCPRQGITIDFLSGRLNFGESKTNAPFPSMLVYFGGEKPCSPHP